MRVLWVTAEPPDRLGGGGNIRQSHLLEALARTHTVDLLLAGREPDASTRAAVRHLFRVDLPPRRPRGTLARRLHTLRLMAGAGPIELFDSREARAALSAAWPTETYDVVLLEHGGLLPLIAHRRAGERWVCSLQSIVSGTTRALHDLTPPGRQRTALAREIVQAQRLEKKVLDSVDLVITVSAEDAAMLPGPSVVIPNGVDPEAFRPTPLPREHRVVFTGTLSYWPNVDGLRWFCAEVLPLVRTRVPDVVFDIVGRDAEPEVRALADGVVVRLHPDVPAVQPYLDAARVCVVPLRIGTGSRLKALEAMASGRPVAGTSMGLMGLGITDQAIVADDPQQLADGIAHLLTDDDAERLATSGRAHVAASFAWGSLGQSLIAALEGVTSERPAGPGAVPGAGPTAWHSPGGTPTGTAG